MYPAARNLSSTRVCAHTFSSLDTLSFSEICSTPPTCSNITTGTLASTYASICSIYIRPNLLDLPLRAPAKEYATQGAPDTTMYTPRSIDALIDWCSYIASNPLRIRKAFRARKSISDPPTTTTRWLSSVPRLQTACPKLSTPAKDAKTGTALGLVHDSLTLVNLPDTSGVWLLVSFSYLVFWPLILAISFNCWGSCCNHFLTSNEPGFLKELCNSTTTMESRMVLYLVSPSSVVCFQPVSIISKPHIIPFLSSMSDCLTSPVATNLARVSVLLIRHSNSWKYMFCASSPNNHVRGLMLIPRSRSNGKGLTLSRSESSKFNLLKASVNGLDQKLSFCSTDPGSNPIPDPPALTRGLVCMISSSNPAWSAKNPHNMTVNVLPEPASPWHITVSMLGSHKEVI